MSSSSSSVDLGAQETRFWSQDIARVAVGCSIGCDPGEGTVESGFTCCTWVEGDSWGVKGSVSASLTCTGSGKCRKRFDLSEGAGGAGVLVI